jgi:hypothetical protein
VAIIRVARPFTLNRHPQISWRFGVGVYDIADPEYSQIVSTQALRWHLDVEVLARGESLLQHRTPAMGYYGGSVWYRALTRVPSIEAQLVLIWRWPPTMSNATDFPFHPDYLVAAPGEQVTVRSPHVNADKKTGEWRSERRTAIYRAMPWGGGYLGHGTPIAVPDSHPFPVSNPAVGDAIVFGVPASTPLRLDTPPPAIPALDPKQAALMQRQAAMVARTQGDGDWLREATIAATREPRRLPADPPIIVRLRAERAARIPRATVEPGFQAAGDRLAEEWSR